MLNFRNDETWRWNKCDKLCNSFAVRSWATIQHISMILTPHFRYFFVINFIDQINITKYTRISLHKISEQLLSHHVTSMHILPYEIWHIFPSGHWICVVRIAMLLFSIERADWPKLHYYDVIMGAKPSQITSLAIVYSTVYSGANQRKHQSSASLAFVRGIHRGPVNSPHKWPVTRKMFPFDDVTMYMTRDTPIGWRWFTTSDCDFHFSVINCYSRCCYSYR